MNNRHLLLQHSIKTPFRFISFSIENKENVRNFCFYSMTILQQFDTHNPACTTVKRAYRAVNGTGQVTPSMDQLLWW